MGRIVVKFKVWNILDEGKVKDGFLKPEDMQIYEGEGLIDSGATTLVLPESVVEKLGLIIDRETTVVYADGRKEKRKIALGVRIEIMGRRATVDCVVEKDGSKVLIGQIPLEEMDLIADLKLGNIYPRPGYEDSPLIELY